jgi:WhiB family transcriptional regulator, redox-sensing transcriptional regulator
VRVVSGERRRSDCSGDWRTSAACRNQDPELFFPIGTTDRALTQLRKAKAVCQTCPVRAPCLDWVLRNEPLGQEAGVCAGLGEGERRSLKRRAARAPQPSLAGPKS